MFAMYESVDDVQELTNLIKIAVNEKRDFIKIKNTMDDDIIYRIFYCEEDMFFYDEIKKYINCECNERIYFDPMEFIVVAFDFDIRMLIRNGYKLTNYLRFENFIFLADFESEIDTDVEVDLELENLTLDDNIFCKPTTFFLTFSKIDLSSCVFLDKLSIFDLYEFNSESCDFNNIYMKNYEISKIELFNCTGNLFELYPEQQDLEMKSIYIRYSKFEEIMINYCEHSKDNFDSYDIEVHSVKIKDSDIRKLQLKDVRADILSIKKSEFENLIFNKVLCDIDFLFKESSSKKFDFSETYFRGKTLFDTSKFNELKFKDYLYIEKNKKLTINNIEAFIRIVNKSENRLLEFKLNNYYYKLINKDRKFGIKKLFNAVIDLTTGYFTNSIKVFFSMLFCIAGFSILYFIFYDYLIGPAIDTINFAVSPFCAKLINSIYFSLISFTTIGYGDIVFVN